MFKYLRPAAVTLVVLLMCASATLAAPPLVEYLGFNPSTFTYTYQVTQGYDADYGFAELEVDAFVGAAWPYTIHDAIQNVDLATFTKAQPWWSEPNYVAYKWISSGIPPGVVLQQYGLPAWVGTFNLTVPNTAPVLGTVIARPTEYGAPSWSVSLPVPAPIIPEPSGLLVLSTGLLGAVAAFKRMQP